MPWQDAIPVSDDETQAPKAKWSQATPVSDEGSGQGQGKVQAKEPQRQQASPQVSTQLKDDGLGPLSPDQLEYIGITPEQFKSMSPQQKGVAVASAPSKWTTLMRKDSIVGHLMSAVEKNILNVPLKDIPFAKQNLDENTKDFSWRDLWDASIHHPAEFIGQLVKSTAADPELLGLPGIIGEGGKIATSLNKLGRAGKAAAKIAEGAAGGAAFGGASAVAEQLDRKGSVDPVSVMKEMGAGAAMGAAMGVGMHMVGDIVKGVKPSEVWAKVKEGLTEKKSAPEAMDEALKHFGVGDEHRDAITGAVKDAAELEATNKDHETKTAPYRDEAAEEKADRDKRLASGTTNRDALIENLQSKRSLTPAQAKQLVDLHESVTQKAQANTENVNQIPLLPQEILASADVAEHTAPQARNLNDQVALERRQIATKGPYAEFFPLQEMAPLEPTAPLIPDESYRELPELTQRVPGLPEAGIGKPKRAPEDPKPIKADFSGLMKDVKSREATRAKNEKEFNRLMGGLSKQSGRIDPKALKWLAIASAGAGIGGYLSDDKTEGAVLGAAMLVGGPLAIKAASRIMEKVNTRARAIPFGGPKFDGISLEPQRQAMEKTMAWHGVEGMRHEKALKTIVPDGARRTELLHYIENGYKELAPRTKEEGWFVDAFRKANANIEAAEKLAGAGDYTSLGQDYAAHFFTEKKEGGLARAQNVFSGMSAKNPHAMHRTIPSYDFFLKNQDKFPDIKPKTLDPAEILRLRQEAAGKAIGRHTFIDTLKNTDTPAMGRVIKQKDPITGKETKKTVPFRMVEAQDIAPADYVSIAHPSLMAYKVHPDLAPSMRILYSAKTPNALFEAGETVNSAMNRINFSFSAFHDINLANALGAINRPLLSGARAIMKVAGLRKSPGAFMHLSEAHNAWMLRSNTDLLEKAMGAGLKIDPKHGFDQEYDRLQNAFQWAIDQKASYPVRLPLKMLKYVDKKSNDFLWGYLHPTMKLSVFADQVEQLHARNTEFASRGERTLSNDEIHRAAASVANDIMGGQNWQASAEAVHGKWGRDLAMGLAQPVAQRLARAFLRAPDWLASTMRSWAKAIPGVSAPEIARAHQRYVFNNLIMLATGYNALNMALSGHPIWENKPGNKFSIERRDGSSFQVNKHAFEFLEAVSDSGRFALNKIGPLATLGLEEAMGVESIVPTRDKQGNLHMTPMQDGRIMHAVKRVVPFSTTGGGLGVLGFPTKGKSDEEKRQDREERKRRRQLAKIEGE